MSQKGYLVHYHSLIDRKILTPVWRLLLLLLVVVLSPMFAMAQAPDKAVPVSVIDIRAENTPATFEFTGKTESSREVEIRARVTGYLDKIAYKEGSIVRKGQLLFQIDPRNFQAALNNAKGALAMEKATLDNAQRTLRRIKPLARENAVSQKDLDDATAAVLGARASVQSAQAQVDEAKINLSYATIRSPMRGLSGRSEKREGSLVTAGQDSLLTKVVQLNPIWVTFSVGENALLKFRQQEESGQLINSKGMSVELVLADGEVYSHKGRIDYVAPTINRETSTLEVRAEIPNPKQVLTPGLFVRVRLEGAVRVGVLMVPQKSVLQGPQGKFVYVVGADNKAESKPVEVGEFYGDQWIITKGLEGGERVITDGVIKVRSGTKVEITPTKDTPEATPSSSNSSGR